MNVCKDTSVCIVEDLPIMYMYVSSFGYSWNM